MISLTAASNSPSNEQQTQPPPSSEMRTFLPSTTFVSIAISPNSFITIAIFAGRLRMWRSNVVLPLPSGPVIKVMGVRGCIDRKSECRNPKFERMSEIQNLNNQNASGAIVFREFGFLSFEFVSDFEIRISDFFAISLSHSQSA